MKLPLAIIGLTWTSLWLTPDQQGQRAMERGDFEQAAKSFESTMYKGVALYRDGDFKQAQAVFSRVDSAEAHYNRGNCLVLLGQYDNAIASYDRALTRKPEWTEAVENRELAVLRAEKTRKQGGEMGDQKIGADKIVFDKKKEGGQDTQVEGDKPADNTPMQDLWLRRVKTDPAEFLRNKFAYQQQFEEDE